MNEDRYDSLVSELRDNLESLLFSRSAHQGRLKAFSNLVRILKRRGIYITPYLWKVKKKSHGSDSFKERTLKIPMIPGLTVPFLTAIAQRHGSFRYCYYHEMGELTYLIPFVSVLIHDDKGLVFSCVGPSDIFGDLLASAMSPIPPGSQLDLLEKRWSYNPYMSRQDNEYVQTQKSTFMDLLHRETAGYGFGLEIRRLADLSPVGVTLTDLEYDAHAYIYGPQLADFYRDFLLSEEEFNTVQRKEHQLHLFDIVQADVKKALMGRDSITLSDICGAFFSPKRILDRLSYQSR